MWFRYKYFIVPVCILVSSFGNYYNIHCVLGDRKIVMMETQFNDYHFLFVTFTINLFIVYFNMISLIFFKYVSLIFNLVVSGYCWNILVIDKKPYGFLFLDFVMCSFFAIVPIIILDISMRCIAEELDVL